jgi:hypothetical protein
MAERIGLADTVQAIRDELEEAAGRASTSQVRFAVGELQLEFTVEVRTDQKTKGGFKIWVLSGDMAQETGQVTTQRIQVTLTPQLGTGPLQIAGDGEGDTDGFGSSSLR